MTIYRRAPRQRTFCSLGTRRRKRGEVNDWSVCTTWHVHEGHDYYLADVLRERFDYPTLRERAIRHAQRHKPTTILIEDTGVGTALVAELRNHGFTVIAVPVEHNKQTRMSVQSGKFASRQVFLPYQAPWLDDLEAELFTFPGSLQVSQSFRMKRQESRPNFGRNTPLREGSHERPQSPPLFVHSPPLQFPFRAPRGAWASA